MADTLIVLEAITLAARTALLHPRAHKSWLVAAKGLISAEVLTVILPEVNLRAALTVDQDTVVRRDEPVLVGLVVIADFDHRPRRDLCFAESDRGGRRRWTCGESHRTGRYGSFGSVGELHTEDGGRGDEAHQQTD